LLLAKAAISILLLNLSLRWIGIAAGIVWVASGLQRQSLIKAGTN
jgi:hypothetical protein